MKMEGFPSTRCSPRLVIPAHAGIQVCCAELAWIPAFAGMTEPRRASSFSYPKGVFSKEDTKSTKFKKFDFAILRCLRDLRGEIISSRRFVSFTWESRVRCQELVDGPVEFLGL